MSRPSRPATSSATRAFAGQAALILFPVVLLAVLASAALRADRREAEQRARERATATLPFLVRSISDQMLNSLGQYEQGRRLRFGNPLPQSYPVVTALERLAGAFGTLPGFSRTDFDPNSALPEIIRSSDGLLLTPAPYPATPRPPPWWINLDPEQRIRWEKAGRLEQEGAPVTNVLAAYAECRAGASNDFFEANVHLALRRLSLNQESSAEEVNQFLQFNVGPEVLSPAGLPLASLVVFEAMSHMKEGPLPPALLHRLQLAVTGFPSLLTPVLLERADGLANQSSSAADLSAIAGLKKRWETDQKQRTLVPWLGPATDTTPSLYWMGPPEDRYFAVQLPGQSVDDPEGNNQPRDKVLTSLIPRTVLESMAYAALKLQRPLLPAYASAEIRLLDDVVVSATGESFKELGRLSLPFFNPEWFAGSSEKLEVILRLTAPEALYADQLGRERWTAALILVAVLSAAFGLWQAGRTLRYQLALNEQKSNFVSAVSHELRAPLASVRLLAEGLANGQVTDESQRRQYGNFLVQETRRLGALVENVLNFARLEQGRTEYEFAPTDARRLVRETVARFEPVAQERQIQLRFLDLTGQVPLEPFWDGLAIQQALANLLDNALKHGPEQSEVTVTISTTDSAPATVQIAVQDHGPGIPEEEQARIFERFYRRGSELRRETRGVGLGLALVQHIVEAHGGRVRVESDVGHGATFTLELGNAVQKA